MSGRTINEYGTHRVRRLMDDTDTFVGFVRTKDGYSIIVQGVIFRISGRGDSGMNIEREDPEM